MFERRVEFSAAYDKRHRDPTKDYGIHGVDLRMYLKGPKGVVQFVVYTGWLLPETVGITDSAEMYRYSELLAATNGKLPYPMPADLGYHSPEPMWEGHESYECDLLEGGKCYYDGSSLNAYNVFAVLTREGGDGVWSYLENYYKELFDENERTSD